MKNTEQLGEDLEREANMGWMGTAYIEGVSRLYNAVPWRSSLMAATGIIALATVGSKLAAACKDMLVASRMGIGSDLDGFLLAMLPPMTMTALTAGSFTPALIPELVRLRGLHGDAAEARFMAAALTATAAMSVAAVIVMFSLRWRLVRALAPGFTGEKLELVVLCMVLLLPLVVLGNVGVTCSAVLNARSRFLLPAAAPLLTVITTICFLLAAPAKSVSVVLLCRAAALGALIETAVLGFAVWRAVPALAHLALLDFVAFGRLKQVASDCGFLSLSTLAMAAAAVITQSFATHYGPGQVAALAFGSKIPGLMLTVAMTAIGGAVLPRFSRLASHDEGDALMTAFQKYALFSLKVTIPVTAALIAFSPQIVSLVFERGRFGSHEVSSVASVQRMTLLQLPFVIPGLLAVRVLTIFKATRAVFSIAVLNILVCASGVYLFGPILGTAGIALAISTMYAVATLTAFALLRVEFARRVNR